MAQRYIYLTDTLNNKLKQEENASALITRLLNEYYKFNITNLEEVENNLKTLKEEKEYRVELIKKETEKLEEVKDNLIDKETLIIEDQERERARENSKRESRNKLFKEITCRDMTNEEYIEFEAGYKQDRWTILDYALEVRNGNKT